MSLKQMFLASPRIFHSYKNIADTPAICKYTTNMFCKTGPLLTRHIRLLNTFPKIKTRPLVEISESREHKKMLMKVYPKLLEDIRNDPLVTDIPETLDRGVEIANHMLQDENLWKAQDVISHYSILEKPENLTEENLKLCTILAWTLEFNFSSIIIMDDIVDNRKTRRGKIPWNQVPGVGLKAIFDGFNLNFEAIHMLLKYFCNHPSFAKMAKSINNALCTAYLGRMEPYIGNINFDWFTMDRYRTICKYKTGHFMFVHPVEMALCMANSYDAQKMNKVSHILYELGLIYQMLNDVNDFAVNQEDKVEPNKESHMGTDIEKGHITWFVVKALEKGTDQQRKFVMDHYGKNDRAKALMIKDIYNELNLVEDFDLYEKLSFERIKNEIEKIGDVLPNQIFYSLVHKVYRKPIN